MKPPVHWGDWSASANDPVIEHGQVNGTHLAHENRFYYWTYIMNINYEMGACFSPHCFPLFLPFTSSKQIMLKCPFSLLSALFHLLAAIKCSLTFQHRPVPYLLCILQCSLTPYEQYTSSQVWVEAAVSTLWLWWEVLRKRNCLWKVEPSWNRVCGQCQNKHCFSGYL